MEAKELDPETREMAQAFLPIFGMEIMKKFFSEDWHLREDAIKEIQKHL